LENATEKSFVAGKQAFEMEVPTTDA